MPYRHRAWTVGGTGQPCIFGAIDFTTIEVWTKRGLVTYYLLFVMRECLLKMIFFGEASLRRAVTSYLAHYHGERNHQGLGNRLIEPGKEVGQADGEIEYHERLGGLLRYYYRDAVRP